MIIKNKFFLLLFFFLIFTTYNFNEKKKNFSIIFPIKKIIINNTLAVDSIKLKAELEFLRNTSLFFLKEKQITKVTDKYGFISNIQLKKKYPNILKILVSERKPVATGINEKKRYYITNEGKRIGYVNLKAFENLPVIFGNHKNFTLFFQKIENSNFNISIIKAFYYFDVGRWDIELKDHRIIKLPELQIENILKELNLILIDSNFSKYKIFDYRIKNQLILQ
jgi:cell division septal protein FtsQ